MSVTTNAKWLSLLLGTTLMSSGLLISQTALAQDEDAAEGDEPIEEIITTGSRIKRADNLSSPTPMVSLGEEQIELTGSINVYDIMNELPQAGASGLTRGNSNFTVGGSGIQTINLRGLGDSRTLTLVNGRRWVGGIPGTGIVDINSIPADLIERLEVVTGGASSVYGSDAVAGVVNIILKDDFEGVTAEAMAGQYFEGDGSTHSLSITAGGNFMDGRGNAIINARKDSQGELMARDRTPYTGRDLFYYGYFYGADFGPPYDTLIADPAYSSYPPQGRFFVSGSTANSQGMLTYDCSARDEDSVLPSDTVVEWAAAGGGDACGFNRTYHRALEVPLDRISTFGKVTFDITEEHELFAEMSYTTVESQSSLEPFPFNSEDIFGGDGTLGYSLDNPLLPDEIRQAALDFPRIDTDGDGVADAPDPNYDGQIPFIRRLAETGNRGAFNTRDTFRVAVGTTGSLGDFDYDWYYQYGENKRFQTSSGQFNAANFRNALDAVVLDAGTPAERIACADPVAVSQGCVPINVFGVDAITPEAAAYVAFSPMRRSYNQQQVFGANLTGGFDVLDREISWAIGYEWREEKSLDDPDDLQEAGLHGGNVIPRTEGEYDVHGAYIEVLVPIVYDMPAFQDLTLEAAYRSDDYSTAGSVDASKVGLNWVVNDSFRARAVYAESVRAPDISDLFSGQAQTYTSINDPCQGLGTASEADMDPTVVANCYSIPDVAATAAAGSYDPDVGGIVPGFVYSQPDIQTISGFVGGNENLYEESAETMTVGLVWTPQFAEGLAVSVDYYDIEIEDVIGSVSATRLINECFGQQLWATDGVPEQCNAHERFTGTGKLRYWYSFGVNQSLYNSTGYDLAATYTMDDVIPGSLRLSLLYTRRDTHEFQTTTESTPFDYVGEVGFNEDKYKLTLVYEIGDFLISLDNTAYGSALDDVGQAPDAYHLNSVGTIWYTDLQVRYFPTDDLQLYFGVDNLFDENPPYCPSCNNEPSPGSHYTGVQYRPWDSIFGYAGIRYSFGAN